MTGGPPPAAGRGASRSGRLAGALLSAAAALCALGGADLLQRGGRAEAEGWASRPLFRDFGGALPGRGRVGDEKAEIRLSGLWPQAPVAVELDLTSRVERRVRVWAGEQAVAESLVGPEPGFTTVGVPAVADGQGGLALRVTGGQREGTVFRVRALRLRQHGPPRPHPGRAAAYALLGAAAFLLARRRLPWPRALALSVALSLLGAGLLALARLQVLAVLPWVAAAVLWAWGALALADLAGRALDLPSWAGRWVAAALLLRLGLAAHPGFGSVDAHWHTHQLWTFAAGGLVVSGAPGVEVSPYPPALYALLLPFSTREFVHDRALVLLSMALMEGLAPLALLGLLRAAGAPRAAPGAAAALAVMPEGLLVLAKGIAANALGSFATLLLVWAALRGVHALAAALLLALVFLSHAAAALTAAALLAAWLGVDLARGSASGGATARRLLWAAAAAAVAWLAYYREVPVVLQDPGPALQDPGVWGLRAYRAGKFAQDLVLKFGLGPVLLAWAGRRAWSGAPPPLRRLLTAWLAVGAGLGLLALLSRFPLRFEYFLAPAVAALAGLGSAWLHGRGRAAAVQAALGLALAVQLAVGLLWLAGRFEIIAVILESPRWPFPVRW